MLINTTYGQICGTNAEINSDNMSQLRVASVLNDCFLDPSVRIDVNVKYHIVRETNGRGGFNPVRLESVEERLNTAFNPHNIYLTSVTNLATTAYDYIDNSTFYRDLTDTEYDALVQVNNDPNALNIYIIGSFDNGVFGRANGVMSRELVITQSRVETHVLSHEVGHCFNLQHTFFGSGAQQPPGSCPESVFNEEPLGEVTDCVNCGDYVCDTPPDHNLGVTNEYTPLLDNIMSYYYPFDSLTPGQGTRMREAFASSPVLQNVVTNLCPELNGPDEVCDTPDVTYNLTNGISTLWEVSSNLQVVSSNLTSITVRHKPFTPGGSGYVRTTTGSGIVVQKDIQVGTAKPTGFVSVLIDEFMGRIKVQAVPVPEATAYEWYVNGILQTGPGLTSDDVILTPVMDCSIMNYTIGVRAVGPCGTSSMYYEHHANPCYQPGGFRYSFAPNPASETLTVLRRSSGNEKNRIANSLTKDVYELHDFIGNRVLKGKLSGDTTIDIRSLKSGRYILTITLENGDQEKHHIIVE